MRNLILAPERVQRMLIRMAYEIVERNRGAGTLELVGIRRRGADVARALAKEIEAIENRSFVINELDVAPYRDDKGTSETIEDESEIRSDITDRDVVLVDDVLFTGRTARAALDGLVQYGRPRSIQLVVLIDRGHREYPIQPDYVGRFIQTKHKERVVVDSVDGFSIFIEE